MRLRTAAVLALALTLGAAVQPAEAKGKKPKTLVKIKLPKAGNASVASLQLQSRSKAKRPPLPKPRLVDKGKLPKDVVVLFGVQRLKQRGRFHEVVVVLRQPAARRVIAHAAQDFSFSASNRTIAGVTNKGVTGAGGSAVGLNVLPGSVLPPARCNGPFADGFGGTVSTGAGSLADGTPSDVLLGVLDTACGRTPDAAWAQICTSDGLLGCPQSPGGDSGSTPGGNTNTPPAFAFTPGPTFTPPAGTDALAVGDFNKDGKPDIVTGASSGGGGSFTVFPNTGGGFGSPLTTSTTFNVNDLATGDFNADGFADIVAMSSSGTVDAFQNDGTGTDFSPAPPFTFNPSGAPFNGLATGLFNGDNRTDLAVTQSDGQVAALLAQPNAGFTGQDFDAGGNGFPGVAVAFGRIDSDAIGDIVVVQSSNPPRIVVLIGAGDGTFGAPRAVSLDNAPLALGAGDVNADSDIDVFVATSAGIEVFQSTPSAATPFSSPTTLPLPAGSSPVGVVVVDVNGDNQPDVLALNRGTGTVSTFLGTVGQGAAGYGSPISTSVGSNPLSLAPLDFSGDGHPDIAVTSDSSGGIFTAP